VKLQVLLEHLRRHGCVIIRARTRAPHAKVLNPANGRKAPVPRHREVKTGTAHAICKQLAVPPPPER
jgi:hypothetical protein